MPLTSDVMNQGRKIINKIITADTIAKSYSSFRLEAAKFFDEHPEFCREAAKISDNQPKFNFFGVEMTKNQFGRIESICIRLDKYGIERFQDFDPYRNPFGDAIASVLPSKYQAKK